MKSLIKKDYSVKLSYCIQRGKADHWCLRLEGTFGGEEEPTKWLEKICGEGWKSSQS